MRKLYTEEEYTNAACQANAEGKKVIKVQETIEVPYEVYEYEKKTIEVPIYDEEGEPTGETKTIEVDDLDKPIMIEVIDEETGEIVLVQKHHTETREEEVEEIEIVDNPENFRRNYFYTSLGYVSRVVHNLNGKTEDFLNDTLPSIVAGFPIITYNADGTQNRNVAVTEEFIQECKQQKAKDFYGEQQ